MTSIHLQAAIRESWLSDMEQILEENIVCNNAAQTEAAVKKHEAISAEILARVRLQPTQSGLPFL